MYSTWIRFHDWLTNLMLELDYWLEESRRRRSQW